MQIQSVSMSDYKTNFNSRRAHKCDDCSPNCRRRGSISPAVAAALAAMVLGGTSAQAKMTDMNEVNPSAFVTAAQDSGDFPLTRSVDSNFPSGVRLSNDDLSQESPLSVEMRELYENARTAKGDTQGKPNYSLLNALVQMGEVVLPPDDLNNSIYKEKDIRKFLTRVSGLDTNKVSDRVMLVNGDDINMRVVANGSTINVMGVLDNSRLRASVDLNKGKMTIKSEDGTKLSLKRDSYEVTKNGENDANKYDKRAMVFSAIIILAAIAAFLAGEMRQPGVGEDHAR